MNKVLYFTNAVSNMMFIDYLNKWSVSPNLSNQNFHNKLIRAIAKEVDVEVVSIRPINSNFAKSKLEKYEEKENNIEWKYPSVSNSKFSKLLLLNKRINEVVSNEKDTYVFVDALNLSLLKSAVKYAKKHNCKVIGVCTDNPENISFKSNYYKKEIIKLGQSLDGYIVLTEAINDLYNKSNKPYLRIDGVSEEVLNLKKPGFDGKYIYFGGSLMEEYGVYNLIEAFNRLDQKELSLMLCGHHVNKAQLESAIKDSSNIKYLGPVNYLDNLALEKYSAVTVNPRPINNKIDEYSIPSKTLECLSVGALNITVANKLLKEQYEDVIIWAKTAEVGDLLESLKIALSLSKDKRDELIKKGKQKVIL